MGGGGTTTSSTVGSGTSLGAVDGTMDGACEGRRDGLKVGLLLCGDVSGASLSPLLSEGAFVMLQDPAMSLLWLCSAGGRIVLGPSNKRSFCEAPFIDGSAKEAAAIERRIADRSIMYCELLTVEVAGYQRLRSFSFSGTSTLLKIWNQIPKAASV
jgi:hypothetical protein